MPWNIRIYRHTDTKDNTRDTRKCQRDLKQIDQCNSYCRIDCKTNGCNDTG